MNPKHWSNVFADQIQAKLDGDAYTESQKAALRDALSDFYGARGVHTESLGVVPTWPVGLLDPVEDLLFKLAYLGVKPLRASRGVRDARAALRENAVVRGLMMPGHPRWNEFQQRLEGPEGCNFRLSLRGPRWDWTCSNGYERTKPILESMRCDVKTSIDYFRSHGGCCDCEILFNVKGCEPRRERRRVPLKRGRRRVTKSKGEGR